MKLDKLVNERFKERPGDAVIDSHALMLRGGYIKQLGSGLFTQSALLRRITKKIETIIREEMDSIDSQEVLFPVVMPASLWQESGRYDAIGSELARLSDRNDAALVLGMTHEEAAVQLVREYGQSYAKYPFSIYQIQTKFRDEARPRGGLIRVREFTMKDAYSYHTSLECLEDYYTRCFAAYERIFKRCGLPDVVAVLGDSGMMGGKVSHEFMLLTPVGEDTVVSCASCDFLANMEAAESIVTNAKTDSASLEKVHTPDKKTIEDVCAYVKRSVESSCKAVVYRNLETGELVVVFIRGDMEVNETKVKNHLKAKIVPAEISDKDGLCAGYLGPIGLSGVTVLYDNSLVGLNNAVCGANEDNYHYIGFDFERDVPTAQVHDFAKVIDGGVCPQCKQAAILLSRGIELGNIFQLGTRYTEAMGMTYLDENGMAKTPLMGCYGIGVERLAAAVCEAYHDDYGPIWPASIAPYAVHLCCVRADDDEVKAVAEELYNQLLAAGVDVLCDDRSVSPGVMFSDADLLGVPMRVIVSPRNLKEGVCEVMTRDKSVQEKVPVADVMKTIQKLL